MQPNESEISEIASLRKQIRLLAIVLFGACVLLLALLVRELARNPSSTMGWPDLSANKLQVKQLVLMTDDGKPAGMLKVGDGSSGLVLLDKKGEVRVLITTAENSGQIALTQDGASGTTYVKDGAIVMGNETLGSVLIATPPVGGPIVKVSDSSGYSAALGRSEVVNKADGSETATSAATLVGSSKDLTSTFSLITQPSSEPTLANESHSQHKKALSTAPSKGHN
jgi:hypothetical protein